MTIFIDLVFILNLILDYLLLLVVNIVLRRFVSLKRVFVGALFGSLTIFFLFIELSSIALFILKIITSIIMIFLTFGYKNIKYTIKNLCYLYFTSILLGGFLYYLNTEFSLKNEGLLFFYDGLSINYIFILIISPIILFFYIKQNKEMKNLYNNYYLVTIYFNDKEYLELNGFYDTGNRLQDPYFHKPIIIVNENDLFNKYNYIYVPYKTVSSKGLMRCFKVNKILFNKTEYKNVLIGISDNKINIDGVECILNGLLEREQ